MKKVSFLSSLIGVMAAVLLFAGTAHAATPVLSLTSNGDGDTVQVKVIGDPSVSVLFFYSKTNVGSQITTLGNTDSSGNLSTTISSSGYGIASSTSVYVKTGGLNGSQSPTVNWPVVSSSGSFSLSPTGLVMSVGQTSSITIANNNGSAVYLSNNSNPPVANVNISGSQINITAISNGSAVLTFCLSGNAQTCASAYVTIQNSGGHTLTFSLSNVTVSPGQSVPITITGGNGSYSVLSNSNSSVIQSNISGSTVTLSTNGTSGSASVTICSSDMLACGIINAAAGSNSTLPLSFSQINPTLTSGQSLNIVVSGGTSSTYYVSSNSNQSAVTTSINSNTLTLIALANGTANIIVCSSGGSCGTLIATVSYTSSGGALVLSQTSATLLVGQVLNITISGGVTPYSLSPAQTGIFQSSINGNVITLSGIAVGNTSLNVCSTGGACTSLLVTVNASGAGTPITFSQNNLSLSAGNITALTISGSGGYYVSTNSNSGVASAQISGNTVLVTALSAGSNNISICQSGGQCSILFVTVTTGSATVSIPTFSQVSPVITAGQVLNETISGGSTSNYYILTNVNPTVVQVSLNGTQLSLTGVTSGSSSVVICAASNSCGVLVATVTGSAPSTIYFTTTSLSPGTVGQAYSTQILTAGGSGSYVFSVTSGNLPANLTLSSSGLLSGTPGVAATSVFSVQALDGTGNTTSTSFTLLISPAAVAPAPTSAPVVSGSYQNGQLIKESGTIYIVYQNTKVAFTNAPAFLGLGFKFNNVTTVTNSGLKVSPKVVITAAGSHPRGSWVSNGKAVYFVAPEGLIPVSDWNTFVSNGGQAGFITKANAYDLARTKLSVLVANDSRLHQ